MVSEGDIVVAELPQSDGSVKLRPVLLIRKLPGFGDFLSCGISSQLRQAEANFDIIVEETAPYFDATGLKSSSLLRLNFLASVPVHRMRRRLGELPIEILEKLQSTLACHLVAKQRDEQPIGSENLAARGDCP